MEIKDDAKMHEATIQGVSIKIPEAFAEGHVCTANEASALNQVLKENVRNNLANQFKKAQEGDNTLDPAEAQKLVDEYVAGYEFGIQRSGGGGSRALSPVDKQARDLASDAVKKALKDKQLTIAGDGDNAIGRERFNELVAEYAAKPEVQKEAERRVKAADSLSMSELGL